MRTANLQRYFAW